ncbi:hypothetical protein AAK967_08925 [Atopobiaceae bacterium 24-176]
MEDARGKVRSLYGAKAREEVAALTAAGAILSGNAYSSVLLVKGEPGPAERSGSALLSGADGQALRSALTALGYAPEDWCAAATWDNGGSPVDAAFMGRIIAALSPLTVVVCDEAACTVVRDALASDLVGLASIEEAMLCPGWPVQARGMRVMALGGFEAALSDPKRKRLMWARMKQLPPLDQPL